ncbi:conserved protein of unknown function [Candidatus Promineifilum breve]|uniref:Uncharacterized protein n=1 Tax=Candidatus Promineifilum breve TaxID=1806508 RepID=A0A160T460_9CHLR|nr:hypothetical protein [Candidatus Promineifilum breve]CUS05061.2 conserved protein of unknown function [Candidatus Promineifilum breve]
MDYTLTVLDTAGIQQYIFDSNELRENIGASELLLRATTLLAFDHLDHLDIKHNIGRRSPDDYEWDYLDVKPFEVFPGREAAEVIYAGGGNTVILFGGDNHRQLAHRFVYSLSKELLTIAPGLALYAAHQPYNADTGESLPAVVKKAMEQLAQLKGELPPPTPLLGLGVTAACTSTGLPAVGRHPSPDKSGLASAASREVRAKWRYSGWQPVEERPPGPEVERYAKKRLHDYFDNIGDYRWSDDLDYIGGVPGREESFIAVVHADGNGMGRRIQQMNNFFDTELPREPRAYIKAMRTLSRALQITAHKALNAMVTELRDTLAERETPAADRPPERLTATKDRRSIFPFRPIVFGGDDVTWVCAGIWGIDLARRYLLELEKQELPDFVQLLIEAGIEEEKAARLVAEYQANGDLPRSNIPYACAGVCIVKTHYPFSQAYAVAEALAKSAKERVRDLKPDKSASAIDWHFTTTGLSGSLEDIRRREYQVEGHNLTARPLVLDHELPTWRNWKNFYDVWRQLDLFWFDSRNKVVALREALRQGPAAVRQFEQIDRQGVHLPVLDLGGTGFELNGGWVMSMTEADNDATRAENRCAYFDAIEVFQMLEQLPEKQEES